MIEIWRASPVSAEFDLLMERHSQAMHEDTPPESIHMLDRHALDVPEIAFFGLRDGAEVLGMGAFKRIDDGHAEIKSMHILREARGRGLAQVMLAHLVAEAQAAGFARLSLETGAQASFVAARKLYEAAGFSECPPFEGYAPDPNSVFMTRMLG